MDLRKGTVSSQHRSEVSIFRFPSRCDRQKSVAILILHQFSGNPSNAPCADVLHSSSPVLSTDRVHQSALHPSQTSIQVTACDGSPQHCDRLYFTATQECMFTELPPTDAVLFLLHCLQSTQSVLYKALQPLLMLMSGCQRFLCVCTWQQLHDNLDPVLSLSTIVHSTCCSNVRIWHIQ